jgi:uncharacterized protein (DUF111 family)
MSSNENRRYEEGEAMLYLECASGISGDMTVGALLDLGADREALQRALDSLPLEGFHTEITRVKKSAIDCCSFSVILDPEFENHDHDMAYLYGKTDPYAAEDSDYGHGHSHEEYGHDHTHEHGHEHSHEEYGHTHEHGHGEHTHTLADGTVITHTHEHTHGHSHAGGHAHRTLAEIEHILADCDMSDHALELAGRIFEILGDAEAKAHGVAPSEVHFHEVGAVDSIVDIVAAAVCLDSLHVQGVIVGSLTEGKGTVRTQHGVLPVPVPAVSILPPAVVCIWRSAMCRASMLPRRGPPSQRLCGRQISFRRALPYAGPAMAQASGHRSCPPFCVRC